jgi:TetR/AcrR family transcriptional regulator, regulator of cefoperazone and chloramphenicol sensitivity
MRSGNSRETIVEAALSLFGNHGIEATSLRQVAAAAKVSPALVVHHFGGKQGLMAAVDEAALSAFGSSYQSASTGDGEGPLRQRAAQTAQVMRERPEVCAYLGRALVERNPASSALLQAMIASGRAEIESLAERGALRADADRLWATLQHFFLIWAPLSFMPLLADILEGPLLADENLARWVAANVELLEQGLYR